MAIYSFWINIRLSDNSIYKNWEIFSEHFFCEKKWVWDITKYGNFASSFCCFYCNISFGLYAVWLLKLWEIKLKKSLWVRLELTYHIFAVCHVMSCDNHFFVLYFQFHFMNKDQSKNMKNKKHKEIRRKEV